MLITTLVIWPAHTLTNTAIYFAMALGGFIPAFVQPYVQKRWFKIPGRFILGVGLSAAGCGVLFVAPWDVAGIIAKVALFGVTAFFYQLAIRFRQKKLDTPCTNCPFGVFPFCAHNLPKLRKAQAETQDAGERAMLDVIVSQLEPYDGMRMPTPEELVAKALAGAGQNVEFIHLKLDPAMLARANQGQHGHQGSNATTSPADNAT